MKTIKINSKNFKKALKAYGVKVKRCQQNGLGVLLTICSSNELSKVNTFFAEFNVTRQDGNKPSPISNGLNYVDYGTVFITEKI